MDPTKKELIPCPDSNYDSVILKCNFEQTNPFECFFTSASLYSTIDLKTSVALHFYVAALIQISESLHR